MKAAMRYTLWRAAGMYAALSLPTCTLTAAQVFAQDPLLDPVRARLSNLRADTSVEEAAHSEGGAIDTVTDQATSGSAAADRGSDALATDPAELRNLLQVHDYATVAPIVARLRAQMNELRLAEDATPNLAHAKGVRSVLYEWSFQTGDYEWIERTSQRYIEQADTTTVSGRAESAVDRLAAGQLRLELLDPDGAEKDYRAALRFATTPRERMEAWTGLAKVAQKRLDWDGSLEPIEKALSEEVLDATPLLALVDTRIRLGETDGAIAANELAIEIDPFNETAQYIIGNGYARKNYTELYAAYPGSFADSLGRAAFAEADRLIESGQRDAARTALQKIAAEHPGWADAHVRLGSLAFSDAVHDDALRHFQTALSICPEYGRAHHGVAKALEQIRFAWHVHRAEDERAFAETPFPEIPGIEQLVVNWSSLSPRHQNRVALSVAPWQRFIPVLVAGGHTYYIKPIHELLSEAPGLHTLRDLRIDYDSRLWDDVRGCGGYHTVTGIEDVERTIFHNYDTVLHELTHQVHGVLPPDMARKIEDLYRQAKERDGGTGRGFLSRYAGGSVWEYFAEAANALSHPRRDRFDTREIVRERLDAIDPALRDLVVEVQDEFPLDPCYPIAYANRGHDELEQGDPEGAIQAYRQALAIEASEPNALGSLVYALQVAGKNEDAAARAEEATTVHPDDGTLAVRRTNADWHAGDALEEVIIRLAAARSQIRDEDLPTVDLELGRMYWIHGDGAAALEAYERALSVQADMPEAIWGRAMAHALEQRWDSAWSAYDEAVRSRTGIVELRCDYAFDLLRAGEIDRAAAQIEEAKLLDATDPRVRALDAWLLLTRGDAEDAREIAAAAAREADWCVLASIVQAHAAFALGDSPSAQETASAIREQMREGSPRFVFRPKWGRYDEVETFPAVERALIEPDGALPLP
jgi:tetratricopeptide (TPR) repeat protein